MISYRGFGALGLAGQVVLEAIVIVAKITVCVCTLGIFGLTVNTWLQRWLEWKPGDSVYD